MINLLENYPELMNVIEVAEILNCRPATVCKLCRTGKLRALKTGKSWTVPKMCLRDYILFETRYLNEYVNLSAHA